MSKKHKRGVTAHARSYGGDDGDADIDEDLGNFAAFPRLLPGGKWELDSLIAEGGWSYIYGASSTVIDGTTSMVAAAVKSMRKGGFAGKDIENECAIHQTLHHENIVRVLDVVETATHVYLVLERLAETLDYVALVTGGLCERSAHPLFLQMAAAIYFLHSRYVAHRDIKLSNFCLSDDYSETSVHMNTVKLIDFGFAFQKSEEDWLMKTLTKSCGSPIYCSPEISADECEYAGWECDCYSLGVSLWMLITDERFCGSILPSLKQNKGLSDSVRLLLTQMITPTSEGRLNIGQIMNDPWTKQLPFS